MVTIIYRKKNLLREIELYIIKIKHNSIHVSDTYLSLKQLLQVDRLEYFLIYEYKEMR